MAFGFGEQLTREHLEHQQKETAKAVAATAAAQKEQAQAEKDWAKHAQKTDKERAKLFKETEIAWAQKCALEKGPSYVLRCLSQICA